MKKKLFSLFYRVSLVFCFLLSSFGIANAEIAPWWGTYCNDGNTICLNVTNVDIKPEGIGFFNVTFFDTDGNELCSMLPVFDGKESQLAQSSFYEFAVSTDGTIMTLVRDPQMATDYQEGCTAALFGTYRRYDSSDSSADACPSQRSKIKETPITLKKAFEEYHAYFIVYDDMNGEQSLRVSYGDKDIYEKYLGKTVKMQYFDVQYYDEHDGECVQTQEVYALDGVEMGK